MIEFSGRYGNATGRKADTMKALKLTIEQLYPTCTEFQHERYTAAIDKFKTYFGTNGERIRIFSAPGRSEIGGNHTDHNGGKVLAAGINLDIIAVAEPRNDGVIHVKSEGFDECELNLNTTKSLLPHDEEKFKSIALLRGVAAYYRDKGCKIGGYNAYTVSRVGHGCGLSTSAAFSVLNALIQSSLYNEEDGIDPMFAAHSAGFAENKFFGKPCGLMDQIACASGGFTAIDFKDKNAPTMQKIDVNFEMFEHSLCMIDTGSKHAEVAVNYASIADDMKKISAFFGVSRLRQISRQDIILNIDTLREEFGDRAILRSLHFFNENERVEQLTFALKNNNFEKFLGLVNKSGDSSFKYLQNAYDDGETMFQPIPLALILSDRVLKNTGACRLHGGGFGGAVQAFVPHNLIKVFRMELERAFGAGSCHILAIRPYGMCEITNG
jgi:galactokinase